MAEIEPLAAALREHRRAGAAIDVFSDEPQSNVDRFESQLRGLDNVILTPHICGSTLEAQTNIGYEVAEKLVRHSDNGSTTSSLNIPEVALPAHPGKRRLLDVRRNVPGVLSAINRVFADNGSTSTRSTCRRATTWATWSSTLTPCTPTRPCPGWLV